MRPNMRLSADDLMIARVKKTQEMRERDIIPDNDDMELMAYVAVFCVLGTIIMVVLALA